MEKQTNRDDSLINSSPDDMLSLVNNQVDQAIFTALNCLTNILSSPGIALPSASLPTPNRSLQPTVSIRCRSSSRNDRRERKVSFHHTMPRCSLPATTNDLVQYQTRSLSYQQATQTRCRSSLNVNSHCSNRTFDIQYSFSLNKPWLTNIDKQRYQLISIQNFVNELVEHSTRAAFLQIDYQNLSNNSPSIDGDDTSCILFDCSPSYAHVERSQIIHSFADELLHSIIRQSIDDVSSTLEDSLEYLATRISANIIIDALASLTNDEKQTRKAKRKSPGSRRMITNENIEPQLSLFSQIRHRSSSALRSLTNTTSQRDNEDSIVNIIAQQIYSDSVNELRRIFTKQHDA